MGYREDAEYRHETKDARLIAKIREAGFNVEGDSFFRTRDGVVKFEDTVIAIITRNTGSSSWRSSHEGWRVNCAQFETRGYRSRLQREYPSNPQYWGGRNYKVAGSVINTLVEAKNKIPTEQEVAEGKALKDWRLAHNKVKSAEANLAGNFNKFNIDFIRWIVEQLEDVAHIPVGEHRDSLVKVIKDLDKLDDRRAAMELRQDELRAARRAAWGEEE